MKGPASETSACQFQRARSDGTERRLLLDEPVNKSPCTRPTSTPLSRGDTPVRYAGKLLKKLATMGAEVTGVSSMPMNGSPLIGWTTCAFSPPLPSALTLNACLFLMEDLTAGAKAAVLGARLGLLLSLTPVAEDIIV